MNVLLSTLQINTVAPKS